MPSAQRLGTGVLLALPAALLAYLSFNGGGFFPKAPALATIAVVQFVIVYVSQAENPFRAITRPVAIAVGSLALFALWILISASWSHAPARSLTEFNWALLYALVLMLFSVAGGRAERLRWGVRIVALTIAVIAGIALTTRTLPAVWPTSPVIATNRLSYPIGYWNGLGIFSAIGAILCLHLTSSRSEPPWVRVPAAVALPVLVTTVYFTFSRGSIVIGIFCALVYMVVARPRALLSGLAATVVPVVIAVIVAYDQETLAQGVPSTAAGRSEGHKVAAVLVACALAAGLLRLALLRVDRRRRRTVMQSIGRPARRAVYAMLALAVFGVIVAGFASGEVQRRYDGFFKEPNTSADLRNRLFDPSSNGRVEQFKVAMNGFDQSPLHGSGAGTYPIVWDRGRDHYLNIQDAHSLYVEDLGELGIVGLILIVTTVLTILIAVARRARGPNRTVYAAVFAAGLAWALHAGVDWDWELPAVTLPFFILGGLALGRRTKRQQRPPSSDTRLAMGLACLACLVVPVFLAISQTRLDNGLYAFRHNDCPQAISKVVSSTSLVAVRPEAYQVMGWCSLNAGNNPEALESMQKARSYDPGNWENDLGVAVALATVGRDPRPEMALAVRRNPLEPMLRTAQRDLDSANPAQWPAAADRVRQMVLGSNLLQISS